MFYQDMTDSFKNASKNLWEWSSEKFLLIQAITAPWALLVSVILMPIFLFFTLCVILGSWLDSMRKIIIDCLKDSAESLSKSKRAYFLTPINMIICFPFAILLALFPYFSDKFLSLLGDTKTSYKNIATNLLKNVVEHGFFFFFIAVVIAIAAAIVAIFLYLIFFILFWLHKLNPIVWFVSTLKNVTASFSKKLADNSGNHFFYAVFNPILLVLFAFPIATFLVLISFVIHGGESSG
ncbi:MAG: hypothetical protein VSS75_005465 [Candidatus Parabeggiatoa sp.]|nr:hypothetical protein [Candidatus Parabeggiatoa sp.]